MSEGRLRVVCPCGKTYAPSRGECPSCQSSAVSPISGNHRPKGLYDPSVCPQCGSMTIELKCKLVCPKCKHILENCGGD